MPTDGRSMPLVEVAVITLLVDRLTAEGAGLLADAGIDCMLVKGPVIGAWLYPDELRPYGDSDLLVAESNWERAIAVLIEHGFRDHWSALEHPGIADASSQCALVRGSENLDLHCTLPGLEASAHMVWESLWQRAGRQEVAGRSVAVPDRPAVLLHLALHAAHHHDNAKTVEDLRRGIVAASLDEWRRAAELAEKLGGLPAFATGLRRLPEGARLARVLDVDHVGSVHFDLRLAGVPTAEGLHELLRPGLTMAKRASMVRAELFPAPSFMRWRGALARRGTPGLLVSYPLRWLWLAVKVPAGLVELRRARRRRAGVQRVEAEPGRRRHKRTDRPRGRSHDPPSRPYAR